MSNKQKVQKQFGTAKAVQGYATSDIHARGDSLRLLGELVEAQPNWQALDVGTGAGHTAHLFAGRVARVIATDVTEAMLAKAAELARERGLTNLETRPADAGNLPFDEDSFDLLTCRLAFHHFPDSRRAIAEFARVLKPGGSLGFTDNFVVPNQKAAAYYNAYEILRDPSHNWVYPLPRLQGMFEDAGFQVQETRRLSKELEFHKWADRQGVSDKNKGKLQELMRNIPDDLQPFFKPRWADGTRYYSLHEVVLIAYLRQD